MKKLIIGMCLGSLIAASYAADKKPLTEAERAARQEEMLKRTGGRIVLPAKGHVALVDCQNRADFSKVSTRFAEAFKGLGFMTKAQKATKSFSMSDLSTAKKDFGAGSVVFIVDDPLLPMSLVSIETHSGLVNVAALSKDDPRPALLTRRTGKMACRVAMLASGGTESEAATSMLQPVTNLKELDANEGLGNDASVMMGVIRCLTKAGLSGERRMTYRQACTLGEAMMPTNQYQKAVWDQVHALPTKPIKILPETKPVKE